LNPSNAASLEALREQIRLLEGGQRVCRRRRSSGVEVFDDLVQGLPCPGIVEICGEPGTGRMRLALSLVEVLTRRHQRVAWVDPLRQLFPPAVEAMGVDLRQLLVLQPAAEGTQAELWATEQLLRSGCFSLVICHLPDRRGSRRAGGHSWARAAEQGECTAVIITRRPNRDVPAEIRLSVGEGRVVVLRDRGGRSGGARSLPVWPEGVGA